VLLRLDCVKACLRRLIRILALIRVKQVRAELRQGSQMHRLVRVLYLTRVQHVIECRSETAQLPEGGVVKFHVGFSIAGRYGTYGTKLAVGFS